MPATKIALYSQSRNSNTNSLSPPAGGEFPPSPLLSDFEHKGPVFFIVFQDMAQQPVPQKFQRAYRDVGISLGISILQFRNLRDEEFMLLFLILKPWVPYDLKPVFFFGEMVTAVLIQLSQHRADNLHTLVPFCRLPQPVKDVKKNLYVDRPFP
jgi:hypothetical protein